MLTRVRKCLERERARRLRDELRIRGGGISPCWLVLSEAHRIPQAQVNPLVRWSVPAQPAVVYEMTRQRGRSCPAWQRLNAEAIFVQSWWDTDRDELEDLLTQVREHHPRAKLIYLDWYAPTHLAQPYVLPLVDTYVKKHVLKDRSRYEAGFHDTNLAEYEARWNKDLLPSKEAGVSSELLEQKLVVGWNFATDRALVREFARERFRKSDRPVDFHCRLGGTWRDDTWYGHMRRRCMAAAEALNGERSIVEQRLVPWGQYLREMESSKICFSPFGFGEVCWRDFEAILSGALLVKPDMEHLETVPDIYKPFETYVPVAWDFSDLDEKVTYYLEHESERAAIARQAVEVWRAFLNEGWPACVDGLWRQPTLQPG